MFYTKIFSSCSAWVRITFSRYIYIYLLYVGNQLCQINVAGVRFYVATLRIIPGKIYYKGKIRG